MTAVRFQTDLSMPEVGDGTPLARLVASVIRKRRGRVEELAPTSHAHWAPAFFGLDRVSAFQEAARRDQEAILERCGRGLLEEAFYIEKSGVAFAAKMVLLAETSDERKLYAMFASDEATHLDGISRFYGAREKSPCDNPFLALLSELIEDGDRSCLQLVIQVVLEGWGLSHYRSLRDGCRSVALREILSGILADEAAHHGSGVLLLGDRPFSGTSEEQIMNAMTRFLAMVQCGPQGTLGALEAELGPFDTCARRRVLEELDAERHSADRLTHLRALMGKTAGASRIAERLERAGRFRPHAITELA